MKGPAVIGGAGKLLGSETLFSQLSTSAEGGRSLSRDDYFVWCSEDLPLKYEH